MKTVSYSTLVARFEAYPSHYLRIPPKIIRQLGGKFRVRLLCRANGSKAFPCALNPLGNGDGFLTLSKARMKELGLAPGDKVKVELTPDRSKYGIPVPPEFREMLKQDQAARGRFDLLSPGKQRSLLHYVSGTANADLRLERSMRVLQNLKGLEAGRETIPAMIGRRPRAGGTMGRGVGRW